MDQWSVWRRVGAYVVCRDDQNRVLLSRLSDVVERNAGSWTMPGGGMEWGEEPADTAVREVREETGLDVELAQLEGAISRWFEPGESWRGTRGHHLAVIFSGTVVGGELSAEASGGTSDAAAWFTLDEIADLPRVDLVDRAIALLGPD